MNEYNMGYLVGCAIGMVVGVILVVALLRFMKKDGSVKCKYDERQETIRGRGFKYGFFTLLICNVFQMFFGDILTVYAEPMVITFVGMCLGIVVYAAYGIWHEGYIALNENPKKVATSFALLGAGNLAIGIYYIVQGEFLENGRICYKAINPICGITLLVVLAILAFRKIYTKESE